MAILLWFSTNSQVNYSSDGTVPYPILVFAAMLPVGSFLPHRFQEASNSLVVNANLVVKGILPRLVVSLAQSLTSLVDFAIALGLLAGMMAIFQFAPPLENLSPTRFHLRLFSQLLDRAFL